VLERILRLSDWSTTLDGKWDLCGFRLGSRLVIAKKAQLLDPRRTVYRLELEEPQFLTLIQPVIALCPWIKARWPE
jgi:hypothetical protein